MRESLSLLTKETITLIQKVLDTLHVKHAASVATQALLFNRALPPILKLLSLFVGDAKTGQSGEVLFLTQHYKYLRSTDLKRLSTLTLQRLNQVFTELKKANAESQGDKPKAKKDADMIEIITTTKQAAPSDSDDFMTSLLDFTPSEYQQVVSQITAQI